MRDEGRSAGRAGPGANRRRLREQPQQKLGLALPPQPTLEQNALRLHLRCTVDLSRC
jgi:hypothetical protein